MMDEGDLDSLVVTERGRPVGIVTQRDIITLVAKGSDVVGTPLKDVISKQLITIDHDATIESVLRLMEEKKIHHIPVMRNGQLVGIIDSQRIRSLSLIDAISIFTLSAHAHYTPYLYGKMTKVYEQLSDRLKDETDIQKIVKKVRDELRKQELVEDLRIEQKGDDATITVEGCMYSRSVHPFIEGNKEVCVMGLLAAMILQKATGRRMRFVDFSDLSETGSETRVVAKWGK